MKSAEYWARQHTSHPDERARLELLITAAQDDVLKTPPVAALDHTYPAVVYFNSAADLVDFVRSVHAAHPHLVAKAL